MGVTFAKTVFCLLMLSALAFASTTGTTTIESSSDASCFNFAEGKAVSNTEDETKLDICLEPWTTPAWCTNFIDMGEVELSSMVTPPTSGFNDDVVGYPDCVEMNEGHSYWIKTREGKYAKVKVSEATYVGSSDAGNVNRLTFDWVYLSSGTTATPSTPPGGDDEAPSACCLTATGFILLLGLASFRSMRS